MNRCTRATARRRGNLAPITYRRVPLLEPDTKLLAMGSCFAVEIQALRERGLPVLPDLARFARRSWINSDCRPSTGSSRSRRHRRLARGLPTSRYPSSDSGPGRPPVT